MRSVVITGASTGIGWATAKLLLGRGFRVFGSVRKKADADRLKVCTVDLGADGKFLVSVAGDAGTPSVVAEVDPL